MTTIYTKPQLDAIAVKLGNKIKEAKTTVTQEQGQSTTYAVSQKMITDSLSAFGTAAYKNVGTEAGNVMEVGAFGVGADSTIGVTASNITTLPSGIYPMNSYAGAPFEYGTALRVTGFGNRWVQNIFFAANEYYAPYLQTKINDRAITAPQPFLILGRNVTKDANGFLRDSNSIAETVAADATGNVAVASIQAGVGAPKIAYKKFVLPSDTPTVAHGLNRDKILDISGVYVSGVERYPYTQAKVNATILDAAPSSTFERHILITYEV